MSSRHLIYICLIALLLFGGFDIGWGYDAGSAVYTHFTYHFAHSSIWHLGGNVLCFYVLTRYHLTWREMLVAYFIASVSSFISPHALPTVGLSGLIYALWGGRLAKCRRVSRSSLLRIGIILLLPSLSGRVNVPLHICCAVAGYAAEFIPQYIKQILRDVKHCDR